MFVALSMHELTGETRYAADARGLLEAVLAAAPAGRRDAMIANVPLHRRIAALGNDVRLARLKDPPAPSGRSPPAPPRPTVGL